MFDKDLFLSLCDKYDVKISETANKPIICEHNKKLVQHINIDMTGIPKEGIYCYGEASLETNMEMQEPLEKLYKYENQPDIREKIKEYIDELDKEIERCELILRNTSDLITESRLETLVEVKNDLQGRLEELL